MKQRCGIRATGFRIFLLTVIFFEGLFLVVWMELCLIRIHEINMNAPLECGIYLRF